MCSWEVYEPFRDAPVCGVHVRVCVCTRMCESVFMYMCMCFSVHILFSICVYALRCKYVRAYIRMSTSSKYKSHELYTSYKIELYISHGIYTSHELELQMSHKLYTSHKLTL